MNIFRFSLLGGIGKTISVGILLVAGTWQSYAYESPVHVFSINDVQGGFDGSTFGPNGTYQDTGIICGLDGGVACPDGVTPVTDKAGITLYPVDSEFGFNVIDFLGAQEKSRDEITAPDFQEGFVGNITDGDTVVGIKISNSATDTYKVKTPFGTWCQGLGGTSIKCSTEHYSVMEHALSCHEVIPYQFADPVTGEQQILSFPDFSASFDCAEAELDDVVNIVGGLNDGTRLTSVTPGVQIDANDNTTIQNDIAVSTDYSVTLKDDGKPLYRWGGLIKRPNDIRLYARIPLPDEWKEIDPATGELVDIPVTDAKLVVKHWITNNPNDQLRPEDLENEAATGRKPSYRVATDGSWISTKDCYEGDGDFIDTDEGSTDPQAIEAGTVFKNAIHALGEYDPANPDLTSIDPLAFSSDLVGGFTNAYYTTIERDPFEWSYDTDPSPDAQIFVGSSEPNPALGELVSGPRWRLRANKFGQDIPGLEIPSEECIAPPFTSEFIKYEVGEPVTTVINLLDWDEAEGPSPLASSRGWVDVTQNGFVTIADTVNGTPVTTNGLPMTDDFDLAVYVKGDRKSTAVFSAQLYINEDVPPVGTGDAEVTIETLQVPNKVFLGVEKKVMVNVTNADTATAPADGALTVMGTDGSMFTADFIDLEAGDTEHFMFDWTAPFAPDTVLWTATVTVDGEVVDTVNATTLVRNKRRGNN